MCTHKKCNSMPRAHSSFIIHECISEHKHNSAIWLWNCEPSTHSRGVKCTRCLSNASALSNKIDTDIHRVYGVYHVCVCEQSSWNWVWARAQVSTNNEWAIFQYVFLFYCSLSLFTRMCTMQTIHCFCCGPLFDASSSMCLYVWRKNATCFSFSSLFILCIWRECVCVYLRSSQVWRFTLLFTVCSLWRNILLNE